MAVIPLQSLLGDSIDPLDCKVHFAVQNDGYQPLDDLSTSPQRWIEWNSWSNGKNDFNRKYVFSLAQHKTDAALWLFGGVFEVLKWHGIKGEHAYEVVLREDLMGPYAKRLWVRCPVKERQRRRTMEGVLDSMTVERIDAASFDGDPFVGHDEIDISLGELRALVSQKRPDWQHALQFIKGVYIIHDKITGERYVGSATSEDTGIWSRWSMYAKTLHGGNAGLIELLAEKGEAYVLENLRIALLEYWPMQTDDARVIARESYWKRVMVSRVHGRNRN